MDNWGFVPGIKRLVREVDLPLQSRSEVRNEWSLTFLTLYAYMARAETSLPLRPKLSLLKK